METSPGPRRRWPTTLRLLLFFVALCARVVSEEGFAGGDTPVAIPTATSAAGNSPAAAETSLANPIQIAAAPSVLIPTPTPNPAPTNDSESSNPAQTLVRGALVICGGGTTPERVRERYLELAGGAQARLVVMTNLLRSRNAEYFDWSMAPWRAVPLQSFDVLETDARPEGSHDDFSRCLEQATAIWFNGGNQNHYTEAYLGTKTHQRVLDLLQRGGVVGGTSAGAAIMSPTMIGGGRTDPHLTTGLGLLPGTIIDQHFRQRRRFERLEKAVAQHPALVGLGIDEQTAVIVQQDRLEVLGESSVSLCLGRTATHEAQWHTLQPGDRCELGAMQQQALARLEGRAPADAPSEPAIVRSSPTILAQADTPATSDTAAATPAPAPSTTSTSTQPSSTESPSDVATTSLAAVTSDAPTSDAPTGTMSEPALSLADAARRSDEVAGASREPRDDASSSRPDVAPTIPASMTE